MPRGSRSLTDEAAKLPAPADFVAAGGAPAARRDLRTGRRSGLEHDRLDPGPRALPLAKPERADERGRRPAGRVRARDRTRPEPGDDRAASGRLGVKVTDLLPDPLAHPLARSGARRRGSRRAGRRQSCRAAWVADERRPAGHLRDQLGQHARDQHRHRVEVAATAGSPSRCASTSVEPPPQNGSNTVGRSPSSRLGDQLARLGERCVGSAVRRPRARAAR